MSVKKHSVFFTSLIDRPTDASCAFKFTTAWAVCLATPPATTLPSTTPNCPDTITQSPARTTGVYGPSAALFFGALFFATDFFAVFFVTVFFATFFRVDVVRPDFFFAAAISTI